MQKLERCQVHVTKNVLCKVPAGLKSEMRNILTSYELIMIFIFYLAKIYWF